MRNQLLDILRYTWYNGLFEFLNFYHIKDIAIEIIPDLYGKILEIDPRTSQLVTTKTDTPWLELGLPVRFATTPDGSSLALDEATLDPTKTYYIHSITGEDNCFRFTLAESPVASEFVELPYANFEFTMIHDRSYVVLKDSSFVDLNMKVVFETLPATESDLADSPLSAETKYYIDSIWPDNKIRLNATQSASDYIHFTEAWKGEIEIVQDNTFIEAASIDQKLHVSGQTDEKIAALHGTFGMNNLGKLWEELLNTKDYEDIDNILVEDANENNEFVTQKFYFASTDKKFRDEYPLIHASDVPPSHWVWQDAKETEWNMTVTADDDTVRRYQLMYKTYDEFAFFDLYTNKISTTHSAAPNLQHYELEFELGMDNPKKGNLVFTPDIYGTYVPKITYEFNTTAEPIAYYSGTITRASSPKRYICELVDATTGQMKIDDTSRLRVGMPIQFENPPDSAEALGQLGLEYKTEYYVLEIIDCENFKVGVTNDSPLVLNREEDDTIKKRKDYWVEWYFYLLVNDYALEMEDVIEPRATAHESRKLLHYIKPGMKIRFENTDDSALALQEAELDDNTDYYVKDVVDSRTILRDASNQVPIWLNANTGEPIEDFLDMDARYPDKNNRPVVTEEEVIITRFTIAKTVDGDTIELPFCHFNFMVFHDVDEIHVDDTRWFAYRENQPIKFTNKAGLSGVEEANLVTNRMYYVHSIVNENRLKIKNGLGDTTYIEFGHTTTKCMQHHNTGKGLLWTSYPALVSPDTDGKEVEIYTRPNIFFNDLNPIPQVGPYTFTFGTVTCQITHDSIWGPYYSADTDYTIGRGKTS